MALRSLSSRCFHPPGMVPSRFRMIPKASGGDQNSAGMGDETRTEELLEKHSTLSSSPPLLLPSFLYLDQQKKTPPPTTTPRQAPAIAAAVATAVGARACASKAAAARAAAQQARPPLVPLRVRVERGAGPPPPALFPPLARARPFRIDD